ncbi:2-C-methyl-D-erythritol 4-phosphate cytidylyltransferase [Veillonella criceti]|uniref:Bifunctional enzyme IspD/IspF n=1 Tax=Veillonella criceti TaxID=103891 RepID=A0A380NIX7_9FIRM|nr:2-C-methyl-D-erythritol 4-phosphate cytidylyltransferase [Veillonella criceti]SUP41471.1 Bifunctional enzyme IspD/IspF [Veillonella criceti]
MISCILLAAGAGKRMQCEANKIFLRLGKYSVLQWNLQHMADVPDLSEVIIVVADGEEEAIQNEVASLTNLPWQPRLVIGGAERQDSVLAGTKATSETADIVLVHDGARPMARAALFTAVAEAAQQHGAAVAAVPVVDTIKQVRDDQTVVQTLRRSELYAVQTPQGFRRSWLLEAQEYAKKTQFVGTDDVSLVEHQGKPVYIVNSDYTNCKLTTPADIVKAKQYLGVTEPMMRVGFGYDVHRFKTGRPCILGGVQIESEFGPDGHSDADVLIHALMDALLGAAGLPDIGYWFPPEDEAFKGASSMELLKQVVKLLHEKGFKAYNVDVMVIAEAPKLKPHINAMKANLAGVLGIGEEFISVKATTHEKLGAFGRLEGLAAQAVATLYSL